MSKNPLGHVEFSHNHVEMLEKIYSQYGLVGFPHGRVGFDHGKITIVRHIGIQKLPKCLILAWKMISMNKTC